MRNFIFSNCVYILWIEFAFNVIKAPQEDGRCDESELKNYDLFKNEIRQFLHGNVCIADAKKLHYDDEPYWPVQWYMTAEKFIVGDTIYSPSMGITLMHFNEYRGTDIGVVVIGNTAVNSKHEDIKDGFKSDTKFSYIAKKPILAFRSKEDAMCFPPTLASAVAGIIGMRDQNKIGGVGVAPRCLIGNIVVDLPSSSPEYCATVLLQRNSPGIDVFVHAWQLPSYNSKTEILKFQNNKYLKPLFRSSKSTIPLKPHVMGSGDSGLYGSTCQCNEYANTDSMFVFGSVAFNGYVPSYSEPCASLIGVTYSTSEGIQFFHNVISIAAFADNVLQDVPKKTTAISAAIGAGMIALITEVFKKKFNNKSPSISDIAFLLAFSSSHEPLKGKNTLWLTNAVGLPYSPQAGFGIPSLEKVLNLIQNWAPLGDPIVSAFTQESNSIRFKCHTLKRNSYTSENNLFCAFEMIGNLRARYIVQSLGVEISAEFAEKRGALSVYLISPLGTVSCLLEGRPLDISVESYDKLYLRSNHFMGETLGGRWFLVFFTYKEDSKPYFNQLYSVDTEESQSTEPTQNTGDLNSPSATSNLNRKVSDQGTGTKEPVSVSANEDPSKKTNQNSSSRVKPSSSGKVPDSNSKSQQQRKGKVNRVTSIKFRVLTVETVPLKLEEKSDKDWKQRVKDLRLLKDWVDFRHLLWVQTDPKEFGKRTVTISSNIYKFMNYFIQKKLLTEQAKPEVSENDSVLQQFFYHLSRSSISSDTSESDPFKEVRKSTERTPSNIAFDLAKQGEKNQ